MKKEEFIKITEKFAKGTASKKEENIVSTFFDSLQDKEVNTEITNEARKQKMFNAIKAKTVKQSKKTTFVKIAAAIILFISLGTFVIHTITKETIVTYATVKGERKNITLPDGSSIFLNSKSSISYAKEFTNNRNVTLNGEAFFKVTKDSLNPFSVETNTIKTTVLGTSFNISSYPKNNAKVTVNTGKVKVQMITDLSKQLFLTKNQSATYVYGSSNLEKSTSNSNNYNAWTKNTLWFKDNNLKEVSEKLENWFNVKITIKDQDLESLKLTGTYKNPKLIEVLESIKFLKNIEYIITNNQITILKTKKEEMPM